jgi:hypothetical protein
VTGTSARLMRARSARCGEADCVDDQCTWGAGDLDQRSGRSRPDAGRQPDDEERQELCAAEEADLERRRVERDDRDQGKRGAGDSIAGQADRRSAPELDEVAFAPQRRAENGVRVDVV